MDFAHIQELIKLLNRSKITDFELEEGDFRLVIRTQKEAGEFVQFSAPTVQNMVQAAQPAQLVQVPTKSEQPSPATTAPIPAQEAGSPAPSAEKAGNQVPLKSPMVGTFYRSSAPGKPAFVKIGDKVEKGAPICIIEAMKLFNEIEADTTGVIVKVLVEDGQPVEYDQPLFLVEPA